ncbi:MAG TPA: hypothetical protein VNM37_09870 [Candidatus Dormibacteraeota bacterium]|nr:hypothetical protein [Candidatus Dormibacteraeota bacterium]
MGASFHFRDQLLGEWTTARGFLVNELEFLYSALGPLGPLIDGLQTVFIDPATGQMQNTGVYPSATILTADKSGKPGFTATLPGPLQFPLANALTTPTVTTAIVNNYDTIGLDQAAQVRMASSVNTVLTGMVAPKLGALYRLLINIGAFTITVRCNDAGSAYGNRLLTPNAVDVALVPLACVWIWYDVTSAAWRLVSR